MFFRIPEPIKALQSAWSGIISDLLYNDLINHGLNTLVEQDRERKAGHHQIIQIGRWIRNPKCLSNTRDMFQERQ